MGSSQSYSHTDLIDIIWAHESIQDQIKILQKKLRLLRNQGEILLPQGEDIMVSLTKKVVMSITKPNDTKTDLKFQIAKLKSYRDELYDKKRLSICLANGLYDDLRWPIWKIIIKSDDYKYLLVQKSDFKSFSELYAHYKNLEDLKSQRSLVHDLPRTRLGNQQFLIDFKTGKNQLFNLLNAYANFDPETGYVQSMNFLAAFIIEILPNQPEDQFIILIYIMNKLKWRDCVDINMTLLNKISEEIAIELKDTCPQVYKHLYKETQKHFVILFVQNILPSFTQEHPNNINSIQIFDLFLIQGKPLIQKLLAQMIIIKSSTILKLKQAELHRYVKYGMVEECLQEYTLRELVDV